MSFEAQNTAIRSRFNTNWGSTPPVKYPNADFTQPANSAFVELQILEGDQVPASLGSTILYRNFGFISINVYVPSNTGTATINGYCDTISAIFRGQQFSGISCSGVKITNIGEIDGRFVKNVSIDFYRDEAI